MTDPVQMRDGRTYERSMIAASLARKAVSPITRQPLSMADAQPNTALKSQIENFLSPPFTIGAKVTWKQESLTVQVNVCRKDTVAILKQKIAVLSHVEVEDQTLKMRGGVLDDSMTLLEAQIAPGICLDVECKEWQIFVRSNADKTLTMQIFRHQTVLDLKRMIKAKNDIPLDVQALSTGGKPLMDDKFLSLYINQPNQTVMLTGRLIGGSQ
jgi:hypothetical protein